MPFKINVSHNGKTYKTESENEVVVGKVIGETINGADLDENLSGYELEITGTSDLSGIPGFKGLEGPGYHRILRTKGPGMHDTTNGIRKRKTNRGEEVSLKTHQINTKVLKEGSKKFADLLAPAEPAAEGGEEAPAEEKKE